MFINLLVNKSDRGVVFTARRMLTASLEITIMATPHSAMSLSEGGNAMSPNRTGCTTSEVPQQSCEVPTDGASGDSNGSALRGVSPTSSLEQAISAWYLTSSMDTCCTTDEAATNVDHRRGCQGCHSHEHDLPSCQSKPEVKEEEEVKELMIAPSVIASRGSKQGKLQLGNHGRAKLRRKISSTLSESRDGKRKRREIGLVRSATVEQLIRMADTLGLSDYVDVIVQEQRELKEGVRSPTRKCEGSSPRRRQRRGSTSSISTSFSSSVASTTDSISSNTHRTDRVDAQLGNAGRGLLRRRLSTVTRENGRHRETCRTIGRVRTATVQELIGMADAIGLSDYVDMLIKDFRDKKDARSRRVRT